MKIGAQLFTVRDFCKTTTGLYESLKRISDIGYKCVQISGTCAFDAGELKAELDRNGLECVITHTDTDRIVSNTDSVIADHRLLKCNKIGIGYYDVAKFGVDGFINRYKAAADTIEKNGMRLCYHNHDAEFMRFDGKLFLEHILDEFTPEELCITLDTYWVQSGGADPIQWIRRLKGRIPCIHLKDMQFAEKSTRRMAPVGEGNMNFDGIIDAALNSSVECALVEQDDCYGEDPFDCLKRSYDYLKAKGLE